MRVALCLSGSLRNFKDTFFSFKEYLLDRYNVDTFFYGPENKEGKEQNLKDFYQLYNPIKAEVTTTNFYDSISCKHNAPNIYYMSYNVYMCNEFKKQHEHTNNFQYDLVIRARPDFFWFRELTDREVQLAKEKVLIPKEWSFKIYSEDARCDMLAIGSSNSLDIYSNLYKNIDNYTNYVAVHPETLCGFNLKTNNIPNIEIDRPIIFEYPSPRIEKYITPYKFIKYFSEPDILDENKFVSYMSSLRKQF